MRKITFFAILLSFSGVLLGQDSTLFKYNLDAFKIKHQFFAQAQEPATEDTSPAPPAPAIKKSPGKALILSAMLPGMGEIYAGSKIKAVLFLAIEVGAWAGTATYLADGKDLERQFEAYADDHWVKDDYWFWLRNIDSGNEWFNFLAELGITPDPNEQYTPELYNQYEDSLGLTHNLPLEKDQQYYEMIGKYMVQFGAGWDDADIAQYEQSDESLIWYWPGGTTRHSEYYMDTRGKSNDALDKSALFIQLVMLNHVFSALDAGFTVRLKNRKIETSMNIIPQIYRDQTLAMGRLTFNW
jgi:hypothetical protein